MLGGAWELVGRLGDELCVRKWPSIGCPQVWPWVGRLHLPSCVHQRTAAFSHTTRRSTLLPVPMHHPAYLHTLHAPTGPTVASAPAGSCPTGCHGLPVCVGTQASDTGSPPLDSCHPVQMPRLLVLVHWVCRDMLEGAQELVGGLGGELCVRKWPPAGCPQMCPWVGRLHLPSCVHQSTATFSHTTCRSPFPADPMHL